MAGGRRLLYRVHAWIGLNAGLLLFVVCFSGTVAVFGYELTWLADPTLRVEPRRETDGFSWQATYDAVAAAHPRALVRYLQRPRGPRWAALALAAYGPGDFRRVHVDPSTDAVTGTRSGFSLASFLRIFHKQLYIVPSVMGVHGTLAVGALAIVLLVGSVAGFLTLRRWWQALATLRSGRSARLWWSDLHRLCGVWPLLVTLILGLTGAWYLAERILIMAGTDIGEAVAAPAALADLRDRPPVLMPLDLDRAAALAHAAWPALEITTVALPARPGDSLVFTGQAEAWLVRDSANQLHMDPYTGAVREIRRGADLGAAVRWIETADPLHFGTFAGLGGRIAWLVAGLMLSGGILAGLYGAWLRLERAGWPPARRLPALAAIVPTVALLLAAAAGSWAFGSAVLNAGERTPALVPLGAVAAGPWRLSLFRTQPADGAVELVAHFDGPGRPNFERAALWIGDPRGSAAARPARRLVDRLTARVAWPAGGCRGACRVNLAIEAWDGARHLASAPARAGAAADPVPAVRGMAGGEVAGIAVFALLIALPLVGWIRLRLRA